MTQFYGITPMELEQFTYREIDEYVVWMNQAQSE